MSYLECLLLAENRVMVIGPLFTHVSLALKFGAFCS